MKLFEDRNDIGGLNANAVIKLVLGEIYFKQEQYQEAILYYEDYTKRRVLLDSLNIQGEQYAQGIRKIGRAYAALGNYELAERLFLEAKSSYASNLSISWMHVDMLQEHFKPHQ